MRIYGGLLAIVLPLTAWGQLSPCDTVRQATLAAAVEKIGGAGWDGSAPAFVVDPAVQRMYVLPYTERPSCYLISTAAAGINNRCGWQGTPPGLHRVTEKFGRGAPIGTVFKSRINTGRVAKIYTDATDVPEDEITTRILWLSGLEPGLNQGGNVDSHARYIYLHGTPEEGLLGTPASHGCIRLSNEAIVALYDKTPVGTLVYIVH